MFGWSGARAPSLLFRNNRGTLEEVSDQVIPDFGSFGIVNEVIATDFDDDGWTDLVVPGTPLVAGSTGSTVITIPNGVFDPVKHYRVVLGINP